MLKRELGKDYAGAREGEVRIGNEPEARSSQNGAFEAACSRHICQSKVNTDAETSRVLLLFFFKAGILLMIRLMFNQGNWLMGNGSIKLDTKQVMF